LRPRGAVIGRVVDPPHQGLGRRGDFIGTRVPYVEELRPRGALMSACPTFVIL